MHSLPPPLTIMNLSPGLPRIKAQISCFSQICQQMYQHVVEHRNVCHFYAEVLSGTNIRKYYERYYTVIKRILNTIRGPFIYNKFSSKTESR